MSSASMPPLSNGASARRENSLWKRSLSHTPLTYCCRTYQCIYLPILGAGTSVKGCPSGKGPSFDSETSWDSQQLTQHSRDKAR